MIQCELQGRFDRMEEYGDVDFLNSATCGFLREVTDRFRFDPEFKKLEDVELSFRLARSGIAVRYVPSAVVEHHHPTTLWAYLHRKFQYGRMAPRFYRRCPEKSLGDGSTPFYRRYQLVLLALGSMALPLSLTAGTILIGLSLALALPAAVNLRHHSAFLAALYPVFSWTGSVALLAGILVGAISMPFQPRRASRDSSNDGLGENE